MRMPDGRRMRFGDGRGPDRALVVHDFAFAKRVLQRGDIGFAEGYVAGEWSAPNLGAVLTFLSGNADRIARVFKGGKIGRALNALFHRSRENSKTGARRNIYEHYDLGNAFYAAWLDPSMTYSSARFTREHLTLEDAQKEKYTALARAMALQPGDRVLEIGCGWGGFAEVAARDFGAQVVGLTISEAQHAFASKRIAEAGLSDHVEIRLQDYRDTQGQFDKIASIEMFEAVGERYWPAYFGKIAETLKPGGRAGLQIITIQDALFESYRSRTDFIQRYVFPGGMLPSLSRLREEVARSGLVWQGYEPFGADYARTLTLWDDAFQHAWSDIRAMGFDEDFKRLWRFYLNYCYAGFSSKRTDVIQLALSK
ncbi:MAG: methyltransferase domain-containing protein [Alphaproteobacteria bacterium]|nr:methyltransferase domain-containing protein [Alphaproteobacteria bacterium]